MTSIDLLLLLRDERRCGNAVCTRSIKDLNVRNTKKVTFRLIYSIGTTDIYILVTFCYKSTLFSSEDEVKMSNAGI
jgi:hypothetical protein